MKVAGIGFRAAAPLSALRQALDLAEAAGGRVTALATTPEKADVPALCALARERGLPILPIPVAGVPTQTQSPRVQAQFGTGSLAEAAALQAAGPGARLTVPRLITPDGQATAAIATGETE